MSFTSFLPPPIFQLFRSSTDHLPPPPSLLKLCWTNLSNKYISYLPQCSIYVNLMLIIISLVGSYQNPCAVENGGCLGLCLLKSKSYSCSCPDGLHLVKKGNVTTCEGKVYNISFEEGRFVILLQNVATYLGLLYALNWHLVRKENIYMKQ